MSEVKAELIDALLSPAANPNAESQYKSIPVPARVQSLLAILQQCLLSQAPNTTHIPRLMLTAVLLRRDVSSLGGYSIKNVKLNSEWEIVRMLGETVKPLLDFFDVCNRDNAMNGVRRQVGFVIAEVCSSLSVMEDDIAVDVMNVVLNRIANGCSAGDMPSLYLLSSLAQQSPLSLKKAKGNELPSLLQATISALVKTIDENNAPNNQLIHQLQCIQVIFEAMNHISIACDMVYPQSLSENPKERMIQLIQIMSQTETNPKKLSIQPNSKAAVIGKSCLPPLLNAIITIINKATASSSLSSFEDAIQSIMQTLSHCASTCPSLLSGGDINLATMVCQTFVSIGENNYLDPTVKLSALEALATLCMVPDMKQLLLQNESLRNLCLVGNSNGGNNGGIIGVCAELIVKGVDDDVDDWALEEVALQDDGMQWENDDVAIFAEMVLNTFLQNGGGGSQSLPIILSVVDLLLKSTEWQNLRAGLIILEACLISSPHSFAVHVPVAVEAALSFCNQACVRVQYQAIQLLGSLCEADGIAQERSGRSSSQPIVGVRKEHGMRMLQSYAQLLASKCSKIVCHACLGIISFCRGGNVGTSVDSSYILPYLGDLLNAIATGPLTLDVRSNIVVYIRSFASVACLADVVETEFAPFYDNIIPGLMECVSFGLEHDSNGGVLVSGSSAHEIIALRGAAIEAVTIVGKAIGSEDGRFNSEAQKIMSLIVPLLQYRASSDTAPTMIPQDQLLAAAARISSIIGASYTPFIPIVLPHLLQVAKEKTDVSITDGNSDSVDQTTDFDEETGMETITVNLPGMGMKKLVLNTTQIQEKSLAARAVYEHASSMGPAFGPYTSDCFQAFLPLLNFKYSAEVRSTAAQALGAIFDSACEFNVTSEHSHIHTLSQIYPSLLLAMSTQLQTEEADDTETLIAFSEALSDVCCSAFVHTSKDGKHVAYLSQEQANEFTSSVLKVIGCSLNRRSEIFSSLENIFDADHRGELEDILDIESQLLTNLVDSIGFNLKCLRENFLPIFEGCILPAFGPILTMPGTNDPRARFSALCLFCDSVEHCGAEAAAKYGHILCEGVMQGLNDSLNGKDIELKEVSVYSIAQLARYSPPEILNNAVEKIAPQLISFAKEGESKEKDEIQELRLVENSASAIATLSLFPKSPFHQIDGLNKSEILSTFMSNLPLSEDEDEAKFCHQGLCDLVSNGEINVMGNVELMVKIIGGIAAAVMDDEDIATEETCSQLTSILKTIQQNSNHAIMQQAFAKLPVESQNGINMFLNQR